MKKWGICCGLLLLIVMVCALEQNIIFTYLEMINLDGIRSFHIEPTTWSSLEEKNGLRSDQFYDRLTIEMMQSHFAPEKRKKSLPGFFLRRGIFRPKYQEFRGIYETILGDIRCFPVADDISGEADVSFVDSWGAIRTYGGERRHEGTDIMASNNKRGYFPITSMTDGVVEKKGWLPQGGYRIGVRSPHGAYFYYAHLASYEEGIEEGVPVRAGNVLGYMGDTGYSEVEGTVGKFDVHLHMGIYMDYQGKETSVNPYYILEHYKMERRSFYLIGD